MIFLGGDLGTLRKRLLMFMAAGPNTGSSTCLKRAGAFYRENKSGRGRLEREGSQGRQYQEGTTYIVRGGEGCGNGLIVVQADCLLALGVGLLTGRSGDLITLQSLQGKPLGYLPQSVPKVIRCWVTSLNANLAR